MTIGEIEAMPVGIEAAKELARWYHLECRRTGETPVINPLFRKAVEGPLGHWIYENDLSENAEWNDFVKNLKKEISSHE